ncbi:MAG: nucleotidyl transferase AbiEii/AbiGii toxin family protein [Proteobacteria bacterium]|nr:nucleotidyl transferase AbiEii/AbiGii toxin family protein [Pseudomonadota bacterium]
MRATADIDFAINVDDWNTFSALTKSLVDDFGFVRTKSAHRLELPNSALWIDIIPFGAIAGDDGKYRWPDDPDIEFSTLGFQEALDTAITCRVADDPVLDLKVVHPAVLILIKIISWRDRKHYKRTDAQDVAYAMSYYTQLDGNDMRVYDDPALYEGDLEMGTVGARLAGRDLATLAPGLALDFVRAFIQEEIGLGNDSEFLADMMLGSTRLFADESLYSELLPNLAMGIDEV